ncbi:LCP family protein [Streptomonospora nanhaiensis]|uniref:LCP family protein required for cell wall assembly n=1 Tax=Streptomonospora nanhaiensis TaxID=1323731 RepID=A0A853BHX1_9ACTN|nr:LCP family protein [Streptomonospora nanhaiensis]MBV2366176.1 LCP family protein [Streptomonospora nanhaiensis]MBX9391816.1 LCP family protein [Streptomonospora nanhaiensis]NYI94620.1 LCP family protein required for cell wall assembly [Streptomonospora nanhaiensis]
MAQRGDRSEPRGPAAAARPASTWRALLWTAGSLPLPGLAHLRMRRRVLGWTVLGCYLAMIAALVVAGVLLMRGDLAQGARLAVQGRYLAAASAAVFAVAVLWMTVVVHSWVITRPPSSGRMARAGGVVIVAVLCLCIAAPAAQALRTTYTAYDTINSVFGPEDEDAPHDAANPWGDQDRVNVLLLGGDSGSNRYGMRTDSMIVASIDVTHGDVVLIGLPRNLENAQFPKGTALAEAYPPPYGFDNLLNEVYQTVAEDPERLAIDPTVKDPAADTLKHVIANLTDLDLDYYALVDMKGFESLIDAIGGIDVHIDEPIPYGEEGDVLEAGDQHLNGNEALWYGRSRVNSDDYARMGRQGCLLMYVAEQTEPTTLLTSFQELAGATKQTLRTDIPQSKLPAFIDLAELVTSEGEMATLQLSPPQVNTAHPDWKQIRDLIEDAINEQEEGQAAQGGEAAEDDAVTPRSTPSGEDPADESAADGQNGRQGTQQQGDQTEWQEYTGLAEPSPTTPGRQVGEDATALETICP